MTRRAQTGLMFASRSVIRNPPKNLTKVLLPNPLPNMKGVDLPLCKPAGWVSLWKQMAMVGMLNARGST